MFFLDAHSPGHDEVKSYFTVDEEIPEKFTGEQLKISEKLSEVLVAEGYQKNGFRKTSKLYNTGSQTGKSSRDILLENETNAVCFETSYQVEENGRYYTIDDYLKIGELMAKAIISVLSDR